MKYLLLLIFTFFTINTFAAYQYNIKGNQGWLTFDSKMTVTFDIGTSGKDKNHINFIDRGEGIADYGWYNLESGEHGSFNNGLSASFNENDVIGLYVTDNKGKTYLSTKSKSQFKNDIWGKSRMIDGFFTIAGGNFGSNGTHEYYVFKINSVASNDKTPNGQPLPGILATLIIGGGGLWYLKNRKRLLQ